MFSLQPDKPPFVCLPIRERECVYVCATLSSISDFLCFFWRKCHSMYCLCVQVWKRHSVVCCGVYVSMYACEVRPGGSEPCLFAIYKGDEELRDRTRPFVSISGKTDGRVKARRDQSSALMFVFSPFFDLLWVNRGIFFSSFKSPFSNLISAVWRTHCQISGVVLRTVLGTVIFQPSRNQRRKREIS